ncbi:MAG: AraC family transcriptional regulator [bacterium]|nr:AraC family transcriptional regulator [bacterium]
MPSAANSLDAIRIYDLFVAAWAFFGAGLALVLGIGILLAGRGESRRDRLDVAEFAGVRLRNGIFFALCACIAWFLFHQSLAFSGVLMRSPALIWMELPAVFCIGPLLYLFFRARTGIEAEGFRLRRKHLAHFALPLMALLLLTPYYLLDDRAVGELLRAAIAGAESFDALDPHIAFLTVFRTGSFAESPVVYVLAFASEASIVAYTLPVLWNLRDVFRPAMFFAASGAKLPADLEASTAANSFRWLTAILALGAALIALVGLGALAGYIELARLTALLITGTVCFLYFVDRAYPSYFDRLFEAGRRSRYRKTRLAGLDTDRVAERLDREMREARPYLRDDLTLGALAADLGMSHHQLSEFLNDRLGKSFHTMVNEYRVQAACDLLRESDDTVLSIAFAVGFNNRASFNAAFAKYTGTTPIAFRRSAVRRVTAPQ